MKVLVLGGSIRASIRNRDLVCRLARDAGDINGYIERAGKELARGARLCNSEILAGAAMLGAVDMGARVDYLPLVHLFPRKDTGVFELGEDATARELSHIDSLAVESDVLEELLKYLETADGAILSTPVYFGDRSSVANKFLQITAVRNALRDKVFAMVSVGAKRNGGQETTNIFSLYEALNQDSLVVGNGPPTSQYGGTAIGGDVGHVLEDTWGLKTVMGTGRKVANIADIFKSGTGSDFSEPVHICILVAIDTRARVLRRCLDNLVARAENDYPWVRFSILELIDHSIYRCLGCRTCPRDKNIPDQRAHCIIEDKSDYMETVRTFLETSDGFIVAGLNLVRAEEMIFRYQVSTERMRFIRRNDFELANRLVAGLCYNQIGARMNPVHSLKVMTSYLRQNTIIHRPIEIIEHQGRVLENGMDTLRRFCLNTRRIKNGKLFVRQSVGAYEPHGEGSGYKRSIKLRRKGVKVAPGGEIRVNEVNRLKQYIENELMETRGEGSLTEDTKLFTSQLLDSMDLLDLTTFLEEEFSVRLKSEEIVPENINTIGAMVRLIEKNRKVADTSA